MQRHKEAVLATATPGVRQASWKEPNLPSAPLASQGDSVGVAWVRRFASGRVPSADFPNGLAADSAGNVYVSGVSEGRTSDGDAIVLKYSPIGSLLWEARFSNSVDGYSEFSAVAVDTGRTVYAAGFTTNAEFQKEILVVRYDSNGTELWRRTFHGGGSGDDAAVAIAVAPDGTSFVLANASSPSSGNDILLMSYTSAGDLSWSQQYDGGSLQNDRAVALARLADGTLAVTAAAGLDSTRTGILTLRCQPGGTLLWRSLYRLLDSAAPVAVVGDGLGRISVAGSIATADSGSTTIVLHYLDAGGFDWVASYSGATTGAKFATGLACDRRGDLYLSVTLKRTSYDYMTIKYREGTGQQVWEKIFDNSYRGDDYASGVTVSAEGYVYVCGFSRYTVAVPFDFLTVVMDTSGKLLDQIRNSQGSNDVLASAIIPDQRGNVFVSGAVILNNFDIGIVKYPSHATGEWTVTGDLGNGNDRVGALAGDRSGNLFTAISDGFSVVVQKYDPTSALRWQTPVNAGGSMNVKAIGLDTAGNIFVAGSVVNAQNSLDIFTARLSDSGVVQWVRTYDGPDGLDDQAVALAVTVSGNCIVVGSSLSATTGSDIITLAYAPSGAPLWSARYNYPFNRDDIPSSIALDSKQSVYITGTSIHPFSSYDLLLLKYDRNGALLWSTTYDGTGSGTDVGVGVVVDRTDTVFVTGKSYGAATSTDIVLLKYDPSGVLKLASRFDKGSSFDELPAAIAIDSTGMPVIAGIAYQSASSFNFVTLKYARNGALMWEQDYDGPSHGSDLVTGIAVDRYNGIIVTGTSLGLGSSSDIATLRYTEGGFLAWIQRYNGDANLEDRAVGLAVDGFGNAFVGGSTQTDATGADFVVLKYSAPRVEYWPALYDGPGISGDIAHAISISPDGTVSVAGQSEESGSTTSMLALQYSSSGVQGWSTLYPPSGNSADNTRDILVGKDAAPVLLGIHQNGPVSSEYAVFKFAATGEQLWSNSYVGDPNSYNFPTAIALDGNLAVTVTGYGYHSGTGYDFATVRYAGDGTQSWVRRYNDPANANDLAFAVATDTAGRAIVAGMSGNATQSTDITVLCYDTAGAIVWKTVADGPDHREDKPTAIAIDSSGRTIVTGWTDRTSSEHDFFTMKLDHDGTILWTMTYNGTGNNRDEPASAAVDAGGYVYVAGTSYGVTFTNPDAVLLKYSPSGDLVWSRIFESEPASDDIMNRMVLDSHGNVYLTVGSTLVSGKKEMSVVSYDSSGTVRWTFRYEEPGILQIDPADLAIDANGNVFVTATTYGNAWKAMTTLKLHQGGSDAVVESRPLPGGFALYPNYPNPFNSSTALRFRLPVRSMVRLELFSILGERKALLLDDLKPAGEFEAHFNASDFASGVYFCRMNATPLEGSRSGWSRFTQTRKMILLK